MSFQQFPKAGRAADVVMLILVSTLVIGLSVRTAGAYGLNGTNSWNCPYAGSEPTLAKWIQCLSTATSTSTQTATTGTSGTTQITEPFHITASYEPQLLPSYNPGYLRFEGWRYSPAGTVRVYVDGQVVSDAGPVAPDGHIWGTALITLSPGQHTVYLVDLSTGKQSNTVTISA